MNRPLCLKRTDSQPMKMIEPIRLLVVDPDRQVASMCAEMLSDQNGTVHHAHDLKEAKELVRRTFYQVIMIELMLADSLGTEGWIQLRDLRPDATCIITTSSPVLFRSLKVSRPGIIAFMLKPLEKHTLVALVNLATQQLGSVASPGA